MGEALFEAAHVKTFPEFFGLPARYRVLLILAANGKDETSEVSMSAGDIAAYADISLRHAHGCLKRLKGEGLLTVAQPGTNGRPNVYRLNLEPDAAGDASQSG